MPDKKIGEKELEKISGGTDAKLFKPPTGGSPGVKKVVTPDGLGETTGTTHLEEESK